MSEGPPTLDDPKGGMSFANDFDFHFELDETDARALGEVGLSPEVCTPSGRWPRISVLHAIADMVVGISLFSLINPAIPVTVDMSMRFVTPPTGDRLDLEVLLHKVGKKVQTGETIFRDPVTREVVAIGLQVFAATPDPKAFVSSTSRSMRTTGALAKPFAQQMGVRTLHPGLVEMDRGQGRGNAMGGLQGGLVVLLGEMAVESLAEREVVELEVNYLRSVAVGPGQAKAVQLGERTYRVEVRDPGDSNRLCAVMLASTE